MEIEKKVHANNLVAWAKDKPEVLVLSADLTNSVEITEFKQAYPERFISCGLSEQNNGGDGWGLAREGFRPLIHTFAVLFTAEHLINRISGKLLQFAGWNVWFSAGHYHTGGHVASSHR